MMRNILTKFAITLALALSLSAPAALAKGPKHSKEHNAAVKKCNDDFAAANAAANKLKGKERAAAKAKAKADRKQCIASAPK
jgi:hypothetical protein